jgi:hypothetical protein
MIRFFVDQENVFMCRPGDPLQYAQKIVQVLANPKQAIRVGIAGRQTAEKYFHYSMCTPGLANFLAMLGKQGSL